MSSDPDQPSRSSGTRGYVICPTAGLICCVCCAFALLNCHTVSAADRLPRSILVIDQFEELFTHESDPAVVAGFLDVIVGLVG